MRWRRPSVVGRPGGVRLVGVLLMATTAGCGSDVSVMPATPTGADLALCRSLVSDLPDSVVDAEAREVSPDDGLVAAWGDPAIVLRCGVDRPALLEPTSYCFEINGVGWYAESDGKPLDGTQQPTSTVVFTTIGRRPYVEVTVPPDDSRSPVDPLTDVAAAITANSENVHPCL